LLVMFGRLLMHFLRHGVSLLLVAGHGKRPMASIVPSLS
jgi:hypothetical protein